MSVGDWTAFFRIRLDAEQPKAEAEQFKEEVGNLQGLWNITKQKILTESRQVIHVVQLA